MTQLETPAFLTTLQSHLAQLPETDHQGRSRDWLRYQPWRPGAAFDEFDRATPLLLSPVQLSALTALLHQLPDEALRAVPAPEDTLKLHDDHPLVTLRDLLVLVNTDEFHYISDDQECPYCRGAMLIYRDVCECPSCGHKVLVDVEGQVVKVRPVPMREEDPARRYWRAPEMADTGDELGLMPEEENFEGGEDDLGTADDTLNELDQPF